MFCKLFQNGWRHNKTSKRHGFFKTCINKAMQNEMRPKQPPRIIDESLHSPHPPGHVLEETPEVLNEVDENFQGDEKTNQNKRESFINKADKVQDYDWNNGKPEVTPDDVETLPEHKTPEVKNEEALRENKGEKPGDNSFNASEEVNTGQNAG